MLITGIVGYDDKGRTANLINSIFSSRGKKISIVDLRSFSGFDLKKIKDYIKELEKNKTDILIFKIDFINENQELYNYLHFDIMIYADKSDVLKEEAEKHMEKAGWVFSMLDEKGIAIVSVDDKDIIRLLQDMKYQIVTYGFNSKASITTSSIGDSVLNDNFMCCLQKSITAGKGAHIEPQEFSIRVPDKDTDSYNILAAASFAIVNGVDLNML